MSIYDLGAIMICGVVGYIIVAKFITSRRHNDKSKSDNWSGGTKNSNNQSEYSGKDANVYDIENKWPKILGVSPVATVGEIKAAYQKLMSQYHPDKVATLGTEIRVVAERKSKEINAAYKHVVAKYGEQFFKV